MLTSKASGDVTYHDSMHALPGVLCCVLCMAEHIPVNNSKRNNPVAQMRLKLTKLQQVASSCYENYSAAD